MKVRESATLFSYGVCRVWAPPRGLYYSFAIHVVIFFTLAFSSPLERLLFPVHLQVAPMTAASADHEVLVLPDLGGGSEGREGGHQGSGDAPKRLTSGKSGGGPPAGMVYQGPQPMISNPRNPDNLVQTIRQPDLVSPPKLPFPIPVPNTVLLAARPAMPVLEKPVIPPAPSISALQSDSRVRALPPQALPPQVITIAPAQPRPLQIDPPKLALPPASISGAVAHPTAAAPVLAARPATAAAKTSTVESSGSDDRNLLVINAINMPMSGRGLNLPPAESNGSFTVVADASGVTSTAAGVAGAPGHGDGANGGSGGGSVGGSGGGSGGPGTGSGFGRGPGNGVGDGIGNGRGNGSGNGSGSGTGKGGAGNGPGSGTGIGSGTGPGSGSGVGPGSGPFRDVGIRGGGTVTGAVGSGGAAPSVPSKATRDYSYGMTIIASGASGGGLRDFGVFRNQAVYTVYLAPDPQAGGPQWVLQYASATPEGQAQPRGVLTPPYPLSRQSPRFPTDVVIRSAGRVMVIYGVINANGKLEGVKILQSPNPLLNQPLTDAMTEWVFKPAELNGQAVGVRILLGIPLATSAPF